jgi:hypothetical protein
MGSKRDKLYGVEEGHGEQKVCTNKTEKKSNIISYLKKIGEGVVSRFLGHRQIYFIIFYINRMK